MPKHEINIELERTLSRNEFVTWKINKGTWKVAVGLCSLTDETVFYLKDLELYNNRSDSDYYKCYSYFVNSMTVEQVREIIEAAKNQENRKVPVLIRRYFNPENAIRAVEYVDYSRIKHDVSANWFITIRKVEQFLDYNYYKGYYLIDKEVEIWHKVRE